MEPVRVVEIRHPQFVRVRYEAEKRAFVNLTDVRLVPFAAMAAGDLLSTLAILGKRIDRPLDVEHAAGLLTKYGLTAEKTPLIHGARRHF